MTLEDLERLLDLHDKLFEDKWRGENCYAASLVIVRPKPPTGYKIKVAPFGNCTILNVQEKDFGIQTCFAVTRKQLASAIDRLKKERAA